jgi:hypothetical protein
MVTCDGVIELFTNCDQSHQFELEQRACHSQALWLRARRRTISHLKFGFGMHHIRVDAAVILTS